MNNKETLSSVRNAIRIIQEFSKGQGELGITDLGKRLGLSKSAVFRIVLTLHEENVLYKNAETRKYYLGLPVFEIGSSVYNEMEVCRIAEPMIEQMQKDMPGIIYLVTYDRGEIVYLNKFSRLQLLPKEIEEIVKMGRRISCHCTASGKVLLAYQKEEEINRVLEKKLKAYTEKTIVSPDKIRNELIKIRSAGHGEQHDGLVKGSSSLSVPIFNDFGEAVAAFSISKNGVPLSQSQKKQIVGEFKMYSRIITEKLGTTKKPS